MWAILAAVVILFLGMFMLLFSGCSERKSGSGKHTESWSGSAQYEKNEHTTPYTRRNHEQLRAGKPYESGKETSQSPAPTTNSDTSTQVEKPAAGGHHGKEIVLCDECGNRMSVCKKCGNRTNYPYGNGRPTMDYAAARKSQQRTKTNISNSTPRSGGKSPSLWPAPPTAPTAPTEAHVSESSLNNKNRGYKNTYDSGLHTQPSGGFTNPRVLDFGHISNMNGTNSNTSTAVNEGMDPNSALYPSSRVHDYGDSNNTYGTAGLDSNNTFGKSAAVSPGPLSARNLGGDQFGYGRGQRGANIAPVHDMTTQGNAY